jgi:hypothetical protein
MLPVLASLGRTGQLSICPRSFASVPARCGLGNLGALKIQVHNLSSGYTIMADGDPLPSWNEGSAKRSILNFVRGVTTADGPQFVNPEERIAVFDNDGTLWSEQPFYFQFRQSAGVLPAAGPRGMDAQAGDRTHQCRH